MRNSLNRGALIWRTDTQKTAGQRTRCFFYLPLRLLHRQLVLEIPPHDLQCF